MKSMQVSFFLYWPVENAQFCINSIGHLGWLSGVSNFPRFHKNVNSLELLKYISENSSPKGSFWRNKRKFEFSALSRDSPLFAGRRSWEVTGTVFIQFYTLLINYLSVSAVKSFWSPFKMKVQNMYQMPWTHSRDWAPLIPSWQTIEDHLLLLDTQERRNSHGLV